jgi:hypothetical protein
LRYAISAGFSLGAVRKIKNVYSDAGSSRQQKSTSGAYHFVVLMRRDDENGTHLCNRKRDGHEFAPKELGSEHPAGQLDVSDLVPPAD